MTSKLSWILFIPFSLAAVFFKLAQTLLPEGSVFGLSNMLLDYVSIGCTLAIFLSVFILCLCDRRISRYYVPRRNIPAGLIGLALAVILAADGANRIYLSLSAGELEAMEIIEAALLLLAAVIFIVMGLTHSFVNRDNKHFALFNVMPALLCAIRLVRCFISFTTISLRTADVTLMFCYVFTTLFFFNLAVTISMTEAKHAVKSCMIFGFPAIAILLARGIYGFLTGFDSHELFANAVMTELVLMGAYILAFLAELTFFIKDKDQVTLRVGEPEEVEAPDEDKNADTFFVTGMDDENRFEADQGYLTSPEFNDYLYHPTEKPESEEEEQNNKNQSDPTGYITEVTEDPHEGKTTQLDANGEDNADPLKTGYEDRLDMIDKLILELTGDFKD